MEMNANDLPGWVIVSKLIFPARDRLQEKAMIGYG